METELSSVFTRLTAYNPVSVLLLAASAISLSLGLVVATQPTHPASIVLVSTSFVLAVAAGFGVHPFQPVMPRVPRLVWGISAAVVLELALLLVVPLADRDDASAFSPLYVAAIAAAIFAAATFLARPSAGVRDPRLWFLVAIHFLLGALTIAAVPAPVIDVHVFQKQGAELFLEGQNPYAIRTFPDLYGSDFTFYGPGLTEDGFLTFGFPYPPLSFFLALPGHVLAGDYRFSQLLAMELAAVLIAATGQASVGSAAGLLFLFTPRTLYLLENGWTEPFMVVFLAAVVFLASRRAPGTAATLGLLAVVKQTMLPALVVGPLLLGRGGVRSSVAMGVTAAAAGLIVSVPLIAWSVPDFYRSAVEFLVRQPFRADAMTIWAWFLPELGARASVFVSFGALALIGVLALFRMPRTPAGYAAAMAVMYFVFFLLGKYAFLNYYYVVLGALCCAVVAAAGSPAEAPD